VCRDSRPRSRSMAFVHSSVAIFSEAAAAAVPTPSTGLFTAVDKEPDIERTPGRMSKEKEDLRAHSKARGSWVALLECPPCDRLVKGGRTLARVCENDQVGSKKCPNQAQIAFCGTLIRCADRRLAHAGGCVHQSGRVRTTCASIRAFLDTPGSPCFLAALFASEAGSEAHVPAEQGPPHP
jgi:hypothetical protein